MTYDEALRQAWPGGIATYTLKTIEEAVVVGTTLRYSWFRGHPLMHGSLTPSVFRPAVFDDPMVEFWVGERFRQRARMYSSKLPAWDDFLGWLLMMQHHTSPTRLLDWTDNFLVALFFAVRERRDEHGEVWCMLPDALNKCSNYGVCGPSEDPIKYLAAEVFTGPQRLEEFLAELKLREKPARPFAFFPALEFPRMGAQLSRFTIHPVPTPETRIEFLLRQPADLVRYRIPAERKGPLYNELSALGITHEALFQSLEGLSTTILEEIAVKTFDTPEPPYFGEG
jgi:hypothetical protein